MPGITGESVKIVPSGLMAGSQSWSVGFWAALITNAGAITQAQLQALATDMDGLLSTWWTAIKAFNTADVDRRATTVYDYLTNQDQAGAVAVSTAAGTVVGTGATAQPTQASLVTTLHTFTAGRRGRGRVYVPATGLTLGTNHQASAGNTTTINSATRTLLSSIQAYTSVPANVASLRPIVRSVADGIGYTLTSVSTNSRVDIQRRRADKVIASSNITATVP